jgi:hypothetical protein
MELNAMHGGIQTAEGEQAQFTKGEQGASGLADLAFSVCSCSQLS